MSKGLVESSSLADIAVAIRARGGTSATLKASEMAAAIQALPAGEAVLEPVTITENGTTTPPTGVDGFSSITTNVPNSFSASDEGKVVSSGALVAQTSRTVTANGTIDTTLNNEVVVNVSGGGGGSGVVLSGTSAPTSSLGNDEDLYIEYEAKDSSYNHTYKILGQYRKESGMWVAYTDPTKPPVARIWTKSAGGNDAAMYVQTSSDANPVSVIYSSVASSPYSIVVDGVTVAQLWYAKDVSYKWSIRTLVNMMENHTGNVSSSSTAIALWLYSDTVDISLSLE